MIYCGTAVKSPRQWQYTSAQCQRHVKITQAAITGAKATSRGTLYWPETRVCQSAWKRSQRNRPKKGGGTKTAPRCCNVFHCKRYTDVQNNLRYSTKRDSVLRSALSPVSWSVLDGLHLSIVPPTKVYPQAYLYIHIIPYYPITALQSHIMCALIGGTTDQSRTEHPVVL